MSVQEILEEVRTMPIEERKRLIGLIVDTLTEAPRPQHTLFELRGLGAEIWVGIDPQEYVNGLRDEWDQREDQ